MVKTNYVQNIYLGRVLLERVGRFAYLVQHVTEDNLDRSVAQVLLSGVKGVDVSHHRSNLPTTTPKGVGKGARGTTFVSRQLAHIGSTTISNSVVALRTAVSVSYNIMDPDKAPTIPIESCTSDADAGFVIVEEDGSAVKRGCAVCGSIKNGGMEC